MRCSRPLAASSARTAHFCPGTAAAGGRVLRGTTPEAARPSAQTYRGYLRSASGDVGGTSEVKLARPQARKGATTVRVTATIRLAGARALILKGTCAFAPELSAELESKGGRRLSLAIDAAGMAGTFGDFEIDGSRDAFASRASADRDAAAAALAPWLGRPLALVWPEEGGWNALSVSIGQKGRVKVSGTRADGSRVNANGQLVVGADWCCVPVVLQKNAKMSFVLWLAKDGSETGIDGLPAEAALSEATPLGGSASFTLDAVALCGLLEDDTFLACLPDGIQVEQRGAKWIVAGGARPGRVVLDKSGAVVAATAGANPSALKLAYRAKDGTFSGSFTAYRLVNGRPKALTVKVAGIVADGVGYGTAKVGKTGTLAVTVE